MGSAEKLLAITTRKGRHMESRYAQMKNDSSERGKEGQWQDDPQGCAEISGFSTIYGALQADQLKRPL